MQRELQVFPRRIHFSTSLDLHCEKGPIPNEGKLNSESSMGVLGVLGVLGLSGLTGLSGLGAARTNGRKIPRDRSGRNERRMAFVL
jgi:hypothetical protein